MLKKSVRLAAISAVPMLLSGCGFITSADSLLSPPMLSEEQSAVYEALTDSVGQVSPVYPMSGENRSAYIFTDLDGDGIDEAAVFYRPSDNDNSIRFNVLDNSDGQWRSVYDHAGTGVSLESASVAAIGGGTYIIAGYNLMSAGDRVLQVYSFADGVINTEYSESYDDYYVTDLTGDSSADLVIVNKNTETHGAYVSLVDRKGGKLGCADTAALSASAVDFQSVVQGMLDSNTAALFIDEVNSGGTVSTEIVYCVGGKLRNPAQVEGSSVSADTVRPAGYSCADIDGDGITEIPVTELLPGYENEAEKMYLTRWNVFENYEIKRKYSGWYSRNGGWCMMFPVRWDGLITVRRDSSSDSAVFCRYNASLSASPQLMAIKAVSSRDSADYISDGWQLITSSGDTDYIVKLSEDSTESLVLTLTEVKNNFFVMP